MAFPLSQFAQGREHLICALRTDPLTDALATMAENDFSQLPVINESGDLCGIVSEQSIVRTQYHLGSSVNILSGLTVEQCREEASALEADRDIFEALARLEGTYAVIIVEGGHPIGMVTDYDATQFFRSLFEGLIWAHDIELTLRDYIERAFPDTSSLTAALMRAFGPDRRNPSKPFHDYEHLSLGEHIQLITAEENWPRFQGALEPKGVFEAWMGRVRNIRNDIAHARGQTGKVELDAVRRAYAWLKERPKLPDPQPSRLEHVDAAAKPVTYHSRSAQGKYRPLSEWLLHADVKLTRVRITFNDIEKLLGEALPPTALIHRQWWANDNVGHVQSKSWLRAGWRVVNVDFAAREVTFQRGNLVQDDGEGAE